MGSKTRARRVFACHESNLCCKVKICSSNIVAFRFQSSFFLKFYILTDCSSSKVTSVFSIWISPFLRFERSLGFRLCYFSSLLFDFSWIKERRLYFSRCWKKIYNYATFVNLCMHTVFIQTAAFYKSSLTPAHRPSKITQKNSAVKGSIRLLSWEN